MTTPSVGVVSTQSNNVLATIMVGNNPVALAVTPDKSKLYVANQGDGTISAFNTVDRSARTITGSLTYPPIWLVARTDSQRVYVLEQTTDNLGGTLAWIDTTSTAGPDLLTETAISVPSATTMVYDSNLNRLYIPGGPQMAIVDISQSAPQLLKTISIPQVAARPCGAGQRGCCGSLAGWKPCVCCVGSKCCAAQPTQHFGGARRRHHRDLYLYLDGWARSHFGNNRGCVWHNYSRRL